MTETEYITKDYLDARLAELQLKMQEKPGQIERTPGYTPQEHEFYLRRFDTLPGE